MIEQKENVKTYFNDITDEYTCAYDNKNHDSLRSYIFSLRREYVLGMFDCNGGNVLDIGCGPAVLTEELLKKGCKVWNSDISPVMVDKARQRLRFIKGAENVRLNVGDIENLEFKDNFFDFVLCIGVLEYLTDDNKALNEIFRVLKPGGYAILSVPNMASPFVLLEKVIIFIGSMLLKFFPISSWKNSLLFNKDITDRYYLPWNFRAELRKKGLKVTDSKFHIYRLAFLNLLSARLSFILTKKLEILSKTPLSLFGVNYIVKVTKN